LEIKNRTKEIYKGGGRKMECFADKGYTCSVLNRKKCKNCNFFKTKKQDKTDREKALERIKKLDMGLRENIQEKYFL